MKANRYGCVRRALVQAAELAAIGLFLVVIPQARADSAELHNTAGLTYFYGDKDQEAFAEFLQAIQKDPSFAQPRFNLGRLFERQNRHEEALRHYREALQLDSTLTGAREGVERMRTVLASQGRPAEAPPLPRVPLPENALAEQIAAVRALIEKNDTAEAKRRVDTLLSSNPQSTDVALLKADLAERAGDFVGAVATLLKVRSVLPGNARISYRISMNLYRIGEYEKAQAAVEQAIQLNPNMADCYHLLGLIKRDRGQLSEAYNALQEASRLSPANLKAKSEAEALAARLGIFYYNTGLYYFQQQAWSKAKEFLKRAVQKGNLNPEQMAIAQQYLVVAEFSAAKVADQIRAIQAERELVEKGTTQKRVLVPEAEGRPASFPEGTYVDFLGWIVARKDSADASELVVTKNFHEVEVRGRRIRDAEDMDGGFRSNAKMSEWYTIRTPRPLPQDPRIAPSSRVRVKGKLGPTQYIRNPYNFMYSQAPQPSVQADYLEIHREWRRTFFNEEFDTGHRSVTGEVERHVDRAQPRPEVNTPPGLAGPLKIDYLRYTEEQLKNLEKPEEL